MSGNFRFNFSMGLICISLMLLVTCKQKSVPNVEIRGIYGNPAPFWENGTSLNELGVNAIFVHSGSIDKEMINRARNEGLKIYAEFATLNGKNYVDSHPEAWPINEKGERVGAASWFMGACPTEPEFRQYRFDQLRNLFTEFDLDGVWMDYVHWHAQFEEPEPILPETCFCTNCRTNFSNDSGIQIPEGSVSEQASWILKNHDQEWRDWRCKVIYDWTFEIKQILNELKPSALLGLYHCPWNDDEFNGARRKILGLDYNLLTKTVDVFSPMVYHRRMGRNPEWVEENILWFSDQIHNDTKSSPKIWPIVQAYNDPGIISNNEFEIVLKGGLAGNSSGVMMFTSYAVAEDEGKTQVMKNVYSAPIK